MKQHSTLSSRIRTLWPLVVVLTGLMVSSTLLVFGTAADNGSDARYNDLGHRMLCTCESVAATGMGLARCRQVLLECTHLNCNVSGSMRAELKAALQRGDRDEVILQSFVQEYGTSVLVAPPAIDKLV
jgi:cytochrome c-type biogenesis protein CcmH